MIGTAFMDRSANNIQGSYCNIIRVIFSNISDVLCSQVDKKIFSHINIEKATRICNMLKTEDKNRSLYAEMLLRTELCFRLGLKNVDLSFCYDRNNKPSVSNDDKIHFSISHSGEYIVVAFDDHPLGVDVEAVKDFSAVRIANHFFTSNEIEELKKTSGYDLNKKFCELWTRKECYGKLTGLGLLLPLDSYSFIKIEPTVYSVLDKEDEKKQYYCTTHSINDDYIISACYSMKRPVVFNEISCIEIMELFMKLI